MVSREHTRRPRVDGCPGIGLQTRVMESRNLTAPLLKKERRLGRIAGDGSLEDVQCE